MKDRNKNILTGLLLFVAGMIIYIFIIPWQLEISTFEGSITPALFPKLATGAIILLSLIMIINELFLSGGPQSTGLPPLTWNEKGRVLVGIAMAASYVIFMNYLGFSIATPLYMLIFMYFLGGRNLWVMLAVSVIVTVGLYWSFGKFMKVPLPSFILFS